MTELIKQGIDEWLDNVDYSVLNSSEYVPSEFALTFMNFIKLVNGGTGESNQTPPVHLKMLDKLTKVGLRQYLANLCFRGSGKTSIFMEYLTLYVAMFGSLPGFGDITGMIYVSDSMENGVKSARKNIEFRYNNSAFLQEWIPHAFFTDAYMEFKNKDGHQLGVRSFGAKALALDTTLYLASGDCTTIGQCMVGDVIIGANGKPTEIIEKSEIFHKPMYEILLKDGRSLKASEDHLNQVYVKKFSSEKTCNNHTYEEKTLTTKELINIPMSVKDARGNTRPLLWIENIKPIEWPLNESNLIDPYTVGILLGDGSLNTKTNGNVPVVLTAHIDDWPTYITNIPYPLGKEYLDKRNSNVIMRTICGINSLISAHNLSSHGNDKKIPKEYLYGSIEQRLHLLQGLMDTDGSSTKEGKSLFSSNSKQLVMDVMFLVHSLGGQASWCSSGKSDHYRAYLRLDMPMFRLKRKLVYQRPIRNNKMAIVSITPIADEPSQCIAVDNDERQFIAGSFIRTHNTGLRGTKIFGKRPTLAVLDDLVSDDDSRSEAAMLSIKDTIYKGVDHALDPTKRKVIFNGTPFNMGDVLVEAVESGAWDVNVWPVCERFPCEREDFVGAWEDRFSFDYIQEQYTKAVLTGTVSGFNQELMLRLTSEEERLIQDAEVNWYSRVKLLESRSNYNFYITTDFATSTKKTADFSVISVWAYNNIGQWFWVDGMCERQTIDKTFDDLFRLAQLYKPQQVGIEISGQQQAYIKLLQSEMMRRNIWFNFASSEKSNVPGIRPLTDKLSRLNLVVPWFKAGMMHFPEEMKASVIMGRFMGQMQLATVTGLKGKDDCLDTISMLGYLKPWKPSFAADEPTVDKVTHDLYEDAADRARFNINNNQHALASYIV